MILKDLLIFINNVSLYHFRNEDFITKIEKILCGIKTNILGNLTDCEILKIFKKNLRILLFLFDEKIIRFDKCTKIWWDDKKTVNYLFSELKGSKNLNGYQSTNVVPSKYAEIGKECWDRLRRLGENEDYICELIRKDSIDDFIQYAQNNKVDLNSCVRESFFETNQMLLENGDISLIQYSAFFGSENIFDYLCSNGVRIDISIFKFAIHGNKKRIYEKIGILSDDYILKKNELQEMALAAIKCFNYDILDSIDAMNVEDRSELNRFCLVQSLKYHNYYKLKINDLHIDDDIIGFFTKYDYYLVINDIIKTKYIDLEKLLEKALRFSCYDIIKLIEECLGVNADNFEKSEKEDFEKKG